MNGHKHGMMMYQAQKPAFFSNPKGENQYQGEVQYTSDRFYKFLPSFDIPYSVLQTQLKIIYDNATWKISLLYPIISSYEKY